MSLFGSGTAAEGNGGYPEKPLALITFIAMATAVGAFLVNQIYDLDVWWHLAIGNDILTSRAIPVADHFARAGLDRPYHDSHWLFQVMLASVHRVGGMTGVEAFMVAVWTMALLFCRQAMRRWVSPVVSNILLFCVAMASVERFLPRPEIITFLMIAIFYLMLQNRTFRSWPELAVLAALQAVWANCHGLFILGPFMAGCCWTVAAVRLLRGKEAVDFPALSRLMGLLLAATLATPFGYKGWQYAFLLFTEVSPSASSILKTVGELSPTFGKAAMAAPAFWFFAVLLAALFLTSFLALLRGSVRVDRLMIACGMGAAALSGRRNMVLFALVAAPLLAELLPALVPARIRGSSPLALMAAVVMLAWSWFPLSGLYYRLMEIPSRSGLGVTPSFFPHRLPEFLDRIGFKGQVYNSNTLGGFYLLHGYPHRLPLTDGRWEVYDERVLQWIRNAPVNPRDWQKLVAAYDIRALLLQHTSTEAQTLLPSLPSDPRWRLVYLDYAASFWLRTDAGNLPPAIDLSAAGTLPLQPPRIDDCVILDAFLLKTGAEDLRIRNLQQALRFGQDTERILGRIGAEQLRLGKLTEAEGTFRELNRRYPDNITALNELAFFAFRRGDFKGAESLLLKALAIDRDNMETRQNLQRVRNANPTRPPL